MTCQKCQTENPEIYTYCNNCGAKLYIEPIVNYEASVKKTKIFFFLLLGYIGLLHTVKFESTYVTSFISDIIFAAIVTFFFILNYKKLLPLITSKITNYTILITLILFLICLAFLVSNFANFLNQSVFNNAKTSYYEHYIDSPFPLLLSIISIGFFPAVFEEIAFRGVLFDELQKITSVNATIIITTLLFTILHFSFISFLWIFPIGLLFGYLRFKYNSILYGIIGHFVYNSSIVLIEYFSLS